MYKDNEAINVGEQKSKQADTGIRYASYYRSEYGQIRRYSQHSTGWTTKDSRGKGLTSLPKLSGRFWSSQSTVGIFLRGQRGRGLKLITHLRLAPTLRMTEIYLQ